MEKAYVISVTTTSDFYIPHALHIERNDELCLIESDGEAAVVAEKDGAKLIYGMDGVPDQVYIDTRENRRIIEEMLNKYPEFYYQ